MFSDELAGWGGAYQVAGRGCVVEDGTTEIRELRFLAC